VKEEHRLRVFENGVLRGMCGPEGMKWREGEENYIT
jgi:hypothetical protein